MPAKGFTIKKDNELIREYEKWTLVRKSLGLRSFGMNMVDLKPGERIPEHTETDRDQEEVFIVLKGTATMVIDDTEYDAPEGTFIRLDPAPRRYAINKGNSDVRLLIVSAPTTSGYQSMDWA
ncbi:MAG: cupin domain-containing protein [Candidatus Komeilibacteria bacterium]|nr:cupin domain-containing protein [Candidatus Komeilibacteria bacterium]